MNFLNKKIFNFEERFVGLDLSDLSVKVLELEKEGKKIKVRSFFDQPIPPGAIENGVIVKKDIIVEAIKQAFKKAGPKKINSRNAICSLPESKAFLRIVSIPEMEEEEAREAVKWEIEASIPLSIDQVYFDWQFIEESETEKDIPRKEKKQSVLTVAVSKDVVDQLIETSKKAGVNIYALEIESIATARSLVENRTPLGEASLIVDLGAKRTSFIIVEGDIPYFTSSIPFSSEGLTDSIAKYFNVDKKEAEKIKLTRGISNVENDDSVLRATESLLAGLIGEIEKTIDFYIDSEKDNREIKKVIICGGGSNLRGLVPYLAKKLSKEIEAGDPWINLNMGQDLPPVSKEQASGYATVVGLAMREINYED